MIRPYLRMAAFFYLSLALALSTGFGVRIAQADSYNDSALGKITAYLPSNGNLPGGTPISVAINNPVDGAVFASGNISIDGTASIGMGVPVANTALVYVLDVSFSTVTTAPGCGGDQNSDGQADQVLDCEIFAARILNLVAETTTGTIGDVGVAIFGATGATADVDPALGDQLITGPGVDADVNGRRDVADVLVTVFSNSVNGGVNLFTPKTVGNGSTNFAAGIQAALDILAASSRPNKMVVFMSDGLNNAGVHINTLLPAGGVKVFTFAVGDQANCTASSSIGNLQEIADLTGGTCTQVSSANIGSLPNILPGVVASQLISLEQSVDAGPFTPIPNTEIDPDLPLNGPASVTYSYLLSGLTPGEHEICVRTNGSDGGGSGSVTDCHKVKVATTDLSITKSDSPDPAIPGGTLTYSLAVTNKGPDDATGVMVTDTLPAGVTFDSTTSSPGCTAAGSVVTCDVGDLANGANATITIAVTVNAATACGTNLPNIAVVTGNESASDPNPGDNTASADTIINCPAGLNIRPEEFPNRIRLGGGDDHGVRIVHVAILSNSSFDAPNDVDRKSLTFGHSGNETSLHRQGKDCWRNDVNHDGLLDLVCNFIIRRTGFQASDTVGILKGKLLDGTSFEAQDSVVIIMGGDDD